jgi:hypothetical protein
MDPELLRFVKKTVNEFGRNFEDNKFVMQFIPIFLILFFSLYTRQFVEVSHSVLGKLFAVIVIIFYTKLNLLYGVFVCVITILFYQLTEGTVLEGMKAPKKSKKTSASKPVGATPAPVGATPEPAPVGATPVSASTSKSTPAASAPITAIAPAAAAAGTITTTAQKKEVSEDDDVEDDDVEDGTNLPDENDNDIDMDMDTEGFQSYKSLYPVINIEDFNAAKTEFIKEKCKNGVIMYKDMPVKPEMVDHVFSEIHFTTNRKCNPCDRTCAYSIVENKLAMDEELTRPKNSNDIFDWIKQLM